MLRFAFAFLLAASTIVIAEEPKRPIAKAPAKTDPAEAQALSTLLRRLLAKNIPDPLSKSSQNWGSQKAVTVVHHEREGLRIFTEPVQEMRNDGVWRRIEVRIPDQSKVTLAVTELTHPEPGTMLASVGIIAERVDVRFEQQVWRTGLRLYSGETRAHCRGSLTIKSVVSTKAEYKKGSFFPTVSLKVRATEAQLYYDDVVVDHTAGVDGEAAKALGEIMLRTVKAVKPNLESDLLAKADAAIVKAAGTREVKVSLGKLLSGK